MAVGLLAIASCGSPEKYRKQPEPPAVTGEAELRLTPDLANWARDLTSALDAGRLMVQMGDTLRGEAITDSILILAEGVLDTVPEGAPLQKFLLLLVADGYGRSVRWAEVRGDQNTVTRRTHRFAALAARLKARHDSAAALSPALDTTDR